LEAPSTIISTDLAEFRTKHMHNFQRQVSLYPHATYPGLDIHTAGFIIRS
jgi:hypothetical protein